MKALKEGKDNIVSFDDAIKEFYEKYPEFRKYKRKEIEDALSLYFKTIKEIMSTELTDITVKNYFKFTINPWTLHNVFSNIVKNFINNKRKYLSIEEINKYYLEACEYIKAKKKFKKPKNIIIQQLINELYKKAIEYNNLKNKSYDENDITNS